MLKLSTPSAELERLHRGGISKGAKLMEKSDAGKATSKHDLSVSPGAGAMREDTEQNAQSSHFSVKGERLQSGSENMDDCADALMRCYNC